MSENPYGTKIQKLRGLRGYSQEYMAHELGLSSAKAYSRYETGETKLDMARLEDIARVLGISLMDLLSFDEKVLFHQCTQNHVLGSHNTYHEGGEKERGLYEARIKHLEEEVAFLREQLKEAMRRGKQ